MFIEPTITWVPSGFSGYIWLDTKIVLKKKKKTIYQVQKNPSSPNHSRDVRTRITWFDHFCVFKM